MFEEGTVRETDDLFKKYVEEYGNKDKTEIPYGGHLWSFYISGNTLYSLDLAMQSMG